ncbi:MAG: D-3-phosphoglycerate dehydrogenase [Patescibacteria group bacterium]|nr:D-3-phosphoglycerate dehydrogenase [Patescibacteria group bacterium]
MKTIVFTDPPLALADKTVKAVKALAGVTVRSYEGFAADEEELYNRGKDADIIIIDMTQYTTVLRRWPKLKAIVTTSVGTDHIDVAYCRERGIQVVNFPGYNARSVAEMSIAILISLLRKVPMAQMYVRGGGWNFEYFEGRELADKTFGIVGAGNVGREMAQIALGLGMRVLCTTKHPSEERARELGIERFVDFAVLLREVDFLAVAVPADASTMHLIGAKELATMKPAAILVNAGRGSVVDTLALADALYREKLAGAALDVIENEPFDIRTVDLRIQEMVNSNNVVVTPHIAFNTYESTERLGMRLIEAVESLVS